MVGSMCVAADNSALAEWILEVHILDTPERSRIGLVTPHAPATYRS